MHQYVANRNVFRNCLKLFPPIIGFRKLSGREFQTDGPATQKARWPQQLSWWRHHRCSICFLSREQYSLPPVKFTLAAGTYSCLVTSIIVGRFYFCVFSTAFGHRSVCISNRKSNFLRKLSVSDNIICQLCGEYAN